MTTDRCFVTAGEDDLAFPAVDRWRSTGKPVEADADEEDDDEDWLDEVALYVPEPSQALYPRPWAFRERLVCTRIRWKDGADCWPYGKQAPSGGSDGSRGRCRTADFFYPRDHDQPIVCSTTTHLFWVHERTWFYRVSTCYAYIPGSGTRSVSTCQERPTSQERPYAQPR
jgi:hypothetical protein